MSTEPTIILVHGAWHGAWCWSDLVPALSEQGLTAKAVELTSHGHDPATVGDLSSDVALIRQTAAEIDGPVVLFGHSYGGVVVTEAAPGIQNLSQIIYLAAFVPAPGESMRKLTGGGNAPFIHFENGLLSVVEGWGRKLFYSDCDPQQAIEAERQLQPQSAKSFADETTVASYRDFPSVYIRTHDDPAVPPHLQNRMVEKVGNSVDLMAGHSPFMSQPKELAKLVRKLVG